MTVKFLFGDILVKFGARYDKADDIGDKSVARTFCRQQTVNFCTINVVPKSVTSMLVTDVGDEMCWSTSINF